MSLKKAMIRWSQSSTIAVHAEVLRQHKGSSGALQRRNRPLRFVPVGASSPKAVHWSKEAQAKSVLAPFDLDLGLTSGIKVGMPPPKNILEAQAQRGERKPV
jgi:hypothetical protein